MRAGRRPPGALIVDADVARVVRLQSLPSLSQFDPVAVAPGREVSPLVEFLKPRVVVVSAPLPERDVEDIVARARDAVVLVVTTSAISVAGTMHLSAIEEVDAALRSMGPAARVTPIPRPPSRELVRLGATVVDITRGYVIRGSSATPLAPCEHALFGALLRRAGQNVSRQTLLEEVWSGKRTSSRVVDRQVFLLRQRIEENPRRPRFIKTVFDEGYRLDLAG